MRRQLLGTLAAIALFGLFVPRASAIIEEISAKVKKITGNDSKSTLHLNRGKQHKVRIGDDGRIGNLSFHVYQVDASTSRARVFTSPTEVRKRLPRNKRITITHIVNRPEGAKPRKGSSKGSSSKRKARARKKK